ncbi:hypothetical protein BDF14DRAFT_1724632 [Spinellus fusiger]|nr:hypothetical protein BDF14DRAFT_1724632 [Spinellus fusiger]
MGSIQHNWNWSNYQYILLSILLSINIFFIKAPSLSIRLFISVLFLISLKIPYIRRFTLPCLPIFTWLITFYACQFIPTEYRPKHIFVNILPTLERILYGANLSEIISKHTHWILDLLAWLPYGVIHFAFPFIFSFILFLFGPPGSLKVFARAFGYMNLAGVLTQLMFPNASPWYENIYGFSPANYTIKGEAGGLARIDDIFGTHLYGSTFGNSPLVFGAFPSLHSGCASIEMLFLAYLFPTLRPLCVMYIMWMWWATMYLTHHYMIDLVGGAIYAFLTFCIAYPHLPKQHPDARTRLFYYGIKTASFGAFVRSIEFMDYSTVSNLPQHHNDEENQLKQVQYNIPVIDVARELEKITISCRDTEEAETRPRIDCTLSIDTDNDSITSPSLIIFSGESTPTCSEPSSPTIYQPPSLYPLHLTK